MTYVVAAMAADERYLDFAVGDAKRRSRLWRLWTPVSASDVYVTPRRLWAPEKKSTFKASLHQSGQWHFAFSRAHVASPNSVLPPGRDRKVDKWMKPAPIGGDIVRALSIIVPWFEIRPGRDEDASEAQFAPPVGEGHVAHLDICLGDALPASQWPGKNRGTQLIGSRTLANGKVVWVLSQEFPYIKGVFPRLRFKGTPPADVDTHAAMFFAVHDDGTRVVGDATLTLLLKHPPPEAPRSSS